MIVNGEILLSKLTTYADTSWNNLIIHVPAKEEEYKCRRGCCSYKK
jgi:hypothetical protein